MRRRVETRENVKKRHVQTANPSDITAKETTLFPWLIQWCLWCKDSSHIQSFFIYGLAFSSPRNQILVLFQQKETNSNYMPEIKQMQIASSNQDQTNFLEIFVISVSYL